MSSRQSTQIDRAGLPHTDTRSALSEPGADSVSCAAVAEATSGEVVSSSRSKRGRITQLGPDDLFALQFIRGACLSPDARWIAYAVSYTDESEHLAIWVMERATGERRRLPYSGNASAPSWSPDGARIAFVGDGRLQLADFPSLAVSEALTPSGKSVEGKPSWSPDGSGIAISLSERRAVSAPRRIVDDVFRVDGLGFLDQFTQRIYIVLIGDRSLRCLTPDQAFCAQPEWCPSGKLILFIARDGAAPFTTASQRLQTVNVDDCAVAEILGNNWYVESARWVPGGECIVVAAARDSTLTIPTLSLWQVNPALGEAELRTPGLIGHVGFRLNHDMPARELISSNGLVIPDRESAFVTVQKGGCVEIWRVALQGAVAMTPVLQGDRACTVIDVNRKADLLLYASTDLHAPPELSLASLHGQGEVRVTDVNDDVLDRWPNMAVEQFSFRSADGLDVDAWFMSLAGRARPLPTVLFIHAGPFLATGNAFRYDFHLLASQGHGVLFANFRGSTGYGEEFVRAIMGDWGGRAYPDHMGAVDAAIARGYADPQRLGVWGPSHGGFATCWIVGHTNRFRAALAEAASTNFTTLYYLTDIPDVYRRDLGGRPHEIPDVYRSRSPITYAHRCTTPTLLVHGEEDLRCPIGEAEQFYRALRDVGCPTELLRIPSCSHIGDSIGPLSARRAQNEALVSWFNHHL
jgi:dipeptidyl aminopeptidase/acylaminoacyl peptidase